MPPSNDDSTGPGCPEDACHEMVGELRDIASWLAKENLPPADFEATIVIFETRKLQRFGLKLSSAVSDDCLVHFTLRSIYSDEFLASMDVDPATGEITIQQAYA